MCLGMSRALGSLTVKKTLLTFFHSALLKFLSTHKPFVGKHLFESLEQSSMEHALGNAAVNDYRW